MKLALDAITVGPRQRKDLGDLDALAASITELGLLQPIVVTPDHRLIAGARRLAAYQQLGHATIPVTIVRTLDDAVAELLAQAHENTCRKDFLISEKVAMADALEPLERAAAKARQGTRTDLELPENFSGSKALDKVAQAVTMSRPSLTRAREVIASGDASLIDDMDRSGKINGVYKRLQVRRAAAAIAAEPPVLPTGPFRVFAADPPWEYENRAEDPSHQSALPYPSMTLAEICAFDVESLAHADAVLWLWTTNSHLPHAFEVITAWGFSYQTMLTWVKPSIGVGDRLRGQTEHCLIGERGRPTWTVTNQSTALLAPRGEHSTKPDAFYDLVEAVCPGSKCELFQRRPREGWTGFGNEVA